MLQKNAILFLFLIFASSLFSQQIVVKFTPDKEVNSVSGNVIVLVSSRKFDAVNPGPMIIYTENFAARQKQNLKANEELVFSLSDLSKEQKNSQIHVCAYLDIDRNFLKWFAPSEGDWYAREVITAVSSEERISVCLNARKENSKRLIPESFVEKQIISEKLRQSGLSAEESTIRFLVGLPPSYHSSSKKYPVLFVSSGFNGNRYTYLWMYKHFYDMMEKTDNEMIIVSLDSSGRYGHHTFTNSGVNGPYGDAFACDIVPYIDKHFRTKKSKETRAVWGQSSGGWTALSLLWHHSDVLGHAFSNSPDPLSFRQWWLGDNRNLYSLSDGTERMLIYVPNRLSVSFRDFIAAETITGSFGQYSSFLSVFSPRDKSRPDFPFKEPFDRKTGQIFEEVWKTWEEKDLYLQVQKNPALALERLSGRYHLYIGDEDEFGLYPPARDFSKLLDKLKISHEYTEFEGANHGSILTEAFAKQLWSTVYESVDGQR